jgi:hypothetical protein
MNHSLNFPNGRSQVQVANSSGAIDNSNPLQVNIGGATVSLGSGSLNVTFSSGTFALLSGNTSIYNSSGPINQSNPFPIAGNVYINSGNVNSYITSGNINAVINSGNINAVINSGNVNSYITSGNINAVINSGNINAVINSGNVTAYVNSGEIHVMSGVVNVASGLTQIMNSGAVVSPTNPLPVSINSGSIGGNGIPVTFAGGATDAFGRLRVSNPFTLFDSQHRYQINDKWDYVTSGGGSTSYDLYGSLVNINTSLASGAQVVCETKRVMPYQPGKSLLIYSTFNMCSGQAGQRQRCGYFGAENGIYFEMNGTTPTFVLRTNISGSVTEERVAKGSWNVDNLNGTGPSGYTLNDFSSSMILFIDIEWLGVGDVRVGFVLNGQYVNCHTFKHTPVSTSPISGTYMTTACLPIRYEITNTTAVTRSGNLKQICNSVISEAGYEGFSRRYNVDLGTTPKNLTNADVLYPIMSIRLASGRLDSIIVPSNLNAIVTSNQNIQYRIVLNPTLTGASWTTHYNGNVQYDISATSIASGSGTNIIGGYLNQQGILDITNINEFNFQLGRTINGVPDIFTVAMAATTANTKVLADLSWFEII